MPPRRATGRYGPGGTIGITVDSSELQELYRRCGRFRPRLRAELREQFGAAAEDLAEVARRSVLGAQFPASPPARRPHPRRSTGLRTQLAASVQVSVRHAGGGVEARVVSRHRMAAPTDGRWGKTWRHPVWGHRGWWAGQASYPWFSRARQEAGPAAREAAAASARAALSELSGRGFFRRVLGRLTGR